MQDISKTNSKNIQTETVNCLICHSDKSELFYHAPNRFNINEQFNLVRCLDCGFVYVNPRPDKNSITLYYDNEEYQPHQQKAKTFKEKLYVSIRKWNNRYKRKLINKKLKSGKILDYGCGTGEFLLEMKNQGWETYGYEPSDKASSSARDYGIQMINSIDSLPFQMDVITMWHVLEHVHDAGALLEKIKDKLIDNGLLVIAVPNWLCFDAKMYKECWVAYDVPRHIYHFRPLDMQSLIKSYNFNLLSTYRLYPDPLYNVMLSAQIEKSVKNKNVFSIIFKILFTATLSSLLNIFSKKHSSSVIYIASKASLR